MGNRFGISGLGSEPVRGIRDVDGGASERSIQTENPYPVLGTYSKHLSSPSFPEREVSKENEVKANSSNLEDRRHHT